MTFRFRPGLTAATLIGLVILSALGTWQLQRRAWKLDLIEQTQTRVDETPIPLDEALAREAAGEDMEYAPVFADGVFVHEFEAPVFGILDGAPGVYVFTPLDEAGGDGEPRLVYVNRGFAPQAFRDPRTRADTAISGEVRVEGLLRRAERRRGIEKMLSPADQPDQNLFYTRDPRMLAAPRGIETIAFYVDSFGRESAGAWPKGGVTRLEFSNRHLEYALTWYGLAAALAGVYLAFSVRRA